MVHSLHVRGLLTIILGVFVPYVSVLMLINIIHSQYGESQKILTAHIENSSLFNSLFKEILIHHDTDTLPTQETPRNAKKDQTDQETHVRTIN